MSSKASKRGGYEVLFSVWVVVAFGTLFVTGLIHLSNADHLASGVQQIGVSTRVSRPLAVFVGLAEFVVGSLGLLSLLLATIPTKAAPLAGALLYGAFTAYQLAAAARSEDAMCACGSRSLSVSKWTIGRSAALFLVCLALLRQGDFVPGLDLPVTQLVAGTALALSIWILPSAMSSTLQGVAK